METKLVGKKSEKQFGPLPTVVKITIFIRCFTVSDRFSIFFRKNIKSKPFL
jgi:hypothetical protein